MIMNILAFCLMGIDKHRARTRQWRIPERVLFGAALLGGSAGAWAVCICFIIRPAIGILWWVCR